MHVVKDHIQAVLISMGEVCVPCPLGLLKKIHDNCSSWIYNTKLPKNKDSKDFQSGKFLPLIPSIIFLPPYESA